MQTAVPDFAEAPELSRRLEALPAAERLRWAWEQFGPRAAVGTSFQGAGLVIIHLARAAGLEFPVFTLDTGLLFPETRALHARLEKFFGLVIEAVEPRLSVAEQARTIEPELWKTAPDLCCHLRKVEPLRARLAALDCWITGVRREQSADRAAHPVLEFLPDADGTGRSVWKLNALADWSREAVWDYLRRERIPYNPLHDRGYRSIGCQPCTRPVAAGENERAGRWSGFAKSECGLHTFHAPAAPAA